MTDPIETTSPSKAKKPYSTPQLAIYGDVRDMTQTVFSFKGNPDTADPGIPQKTSLNV